MSCASKHFINGSGCVRTAQMYQQMGLWVTFF